MEDWRWRIEVEINSGFLYKGDEDEYRKSF